MLEEGQLILFRSFRIIDKWHEGEIVGTLKNGRDIQYRIKTKLTGIHSEVLRYQNDIKILRIDDIRNINKD